jgi:hypothetical protein
VKAARFAVLWWLALAGWWVLLVGTNAGVELVAGACTATIGTAFAAAVRNQSLLSFRFEPAWFPRLLKAPWRLVEGFALVSWALVRRGRSSYRTLPLPTDADGTRALVTLAAALSANTVPIAAKHGELELHELDPRHARPDLP